MSIDTLETPLAVLKKSATTITAGRDYALQTVNVAGLVFTPYDYIAATYPSATQEVYTFKSGGSGGTTVSTVTVNYVDSTKDRVLNVART